jgi:hypothetical protein
MRRIIRLTNSATLSLQPLSLIKKGHGFCRHGLKKRKAMGSSLSLHPWLFWLFNLPQQVLLNNGQTDAK